ncbi:MAG: DUF2723 domain-containing protein [Bacteroidota bacterium]|nr:DUF2723 domain-containing protein [Bacteroidota bacterium]
MYNYNKINNITGWIVFSLATLIYALTVEPTASYWDAGEFIAAAYKLQVPHPPGAPFYLLVGRMFSFLAGGNVLQVAYWINMASVLSSGFTILFLFWSITLLGRKLFHIPAMPTKVQVITLMGAGVVGAMAYAGSDSFWFSAVEAEVYAMSSFFTAFVFWAVLKWELIENESNRNKWLILIAYMMGLSIGVHLLNLVTIPVLGLIYYYKNYTPTRKGLILSMLISGLIIIVIMSGIIPGLPSLAGSVEVFFVNSMSLPFGSGIIFFSIVFLGAIIYGFMYSIKKQIVLLNTALLCLTFILIGYSSYTMVLIRSNFNPPIDENNPENIISFVSYLKREQYGTRPLMYGQYFTAEVVDQVKGPPVYAKGEDKYVVVDHKTTAVYDPKESTILPRAYSNDASHAAKYRDWMNLGPNQKPNFIDNIGFMMKYQMGYMYMRYFLWNFSGRESDHQGAGWLSVFNLGDDLPEILANNKARNNFLMLPLILGLIGVFFHFKRDSRSFGVLALLFFLTGLALVLYLNSPPSEPRERDYIYVGSFYVFAFWIGFGVIAISEFLQKYLKNGVAAPAVATLLCLSVPVIMLVEGWDDHNRSNRYFSVDSAKNFLNSCAPNAIIFTGGDNDTFPLWYAQEVEGFRTDVRVIVLSYFNTDWYINQMTRPAYESAPLPFTLEQSQYRQGGPNDYLLLDENPNVASGIDTKQFLQLVKSNHQAIQRQVSRTGDYINTVPSKTLLLDVDINHVQSLGIIPSGKENMIEQRMSLTVKGKALEKKDLMILDLIATNNWERPIYFNNTSLQGSQLNFNNYVIQEGNAYRLLPLRNTNPQESFVNTDVMYDNLMNNFFYRELDNPNVYYNDDYKNFVVSHRSSFNTLADALIKEGKIEQARTALLTSLQRMPDEAVPYDYETAQTINLLFKVGENEKAMEITGLLGRRADEMLSYLIRENKNFGFEREKNLSALNQIVQALRTAGRTEEAVAYQERFMEHYNKLSM